MVRVPNTKPQIAFSNSIEGFHIGALVLTTQTFLQRCMEAYTAIPMQHLRYLRHMPQNFWLDA